MSVTAVFDQSPAERNAHKRAFGEPTHRAPYPGISAEAWAAIYRMGSVDAPTHRGVPRERP